MLFSAVHIHLVKVPIIDFVITLSFSAIVFHQNSCKPRVLSVTILSGPTLIWQCPMAAQSSFAAGWILREGHAERTTSTSSSPCWHRLGKPEHANRNIMFEIARRPDASLLNRLTKCCPSALNLLRGISVLQYHPGCSVVSGVLEIDFELHRFPSHAIAPRPSSIRIRVSRASCQWES